MKESIPQRALVLACVEEVGWLCLVKGITV